MEKGMADAIEKLRRVHEANQLGGGQKWVDRQRSLDKLLARERIDILVDPGTFKEIGSAVNGTSMRIDGKSTYTPGDGAVTGYGQVHGREVAIYASDFTIQAGSIGQQHGLKFTKLWEYAGRFGLPMVWLLDSSGGRLGQDDIATAGVEWFFWYESQFSGAAPQITVLMGPCIAGQAYAPCLTDYLIMSRTSGYLWLGGPRMVQAATSEKMDDEVGSADYHMVHSGTCDLVGTDDRDSILKTRELLSYLPSNFKEKPPYKSTSDLPDREVPELADLVPAEISKPYDMHLVIKSIVDDGEFFEIKDAYARQIITGYCRFNGQVVGLVANNPEFPKSALECDACDKYYRFLEVLDAYNIPLVNLVDTPLGTPGEEEENRGLLRHGAKIIHLYANTTVPKISVILRQSYCDTGGIVFGGLKGMGVDMCFAWPIAIIGIETSEIKAEQLFDGGIEDNAHGRYLDISKERVDVFQVANTATSQVVDEIIFPSDTRRKIIEALKICEGKEEVTPQRAKQHGAPPT
jgi:methylmalonyl-CoA decarboxylase subunit alpha